MSVIVWSTMAVTQIHQADVAALLFVNQFSGRSWTVDYLLAGAPMLSTAKLLPILLVGCWIWTSQVDVRRKRLGLVSGATGALAALVIGRLLQNLGPERLRPMHADLEGFTLPLVVDPANLQGWSSFPSDHACLAFALATGIWIVSRRLGLAALAWAALIVCLPRVYAGYHYPGDVVAGALIGVGCACACHYGLSKYLPTGALEARRFARPLQIFGLFLGYQFATLFNDVRWFGSAAKAMLANIG